MPMAIACARVPTAKHDLDRQIDALHREGIAAKRIYVDKESGETPASEKALLPDWGWSAVRGDQSAEVTDRGLSVGSPMVLP
jgi:hypothetical protein